MKDNKNTYLLVGFLALAIFAVSISLPYLKSKIGNQAAVLGGLPHTNPLSANKLGIFHHQENGWSWDDNHSPESTKDRPYNFDLGAARKAVLDAGVQQRTAIRNKNGSTSFFDTEGKLIVGSSNPSNPGDCTIWNPTPDDSRIGTYISSDSPGCLSPGTDFGGPLEESSPAKP